MTVPGGSPKGAATQTGIGLLPSTFPEICAINLAIWCYYLNKINSLPSGNLSILPQNVVYQERNSEQQAASPWGGEPHTHV